MGWHRKSTQSRLKRLMKLMKSENLTKGQLMARGYTIGEIQRARKKMKK